MLNSLKHWIKVQQFSLWLWYHDACEEGKAKVKGMTAEEAYAAAYENTILWALDHAKLHNLYRLFMRANDCAKLKQALGFPTKAKDEMFSTSEASRKFLQDNNLV